MKEDVEAVEVVVCHEVEAMKGMAVKEGEIIMTVVVVVIIIIIMIIIKDHRPEIEGGEEGEDVKEKEEIVDEVEVEVGHIQILLQLMVIWEVIVTDGEDGGVVAVGAGVDQDQEIEEIE